MFRSCSLSPSIYLIVAVSLVQSLLAQVTFPDSKFKNLDYGLYWFNYKGATKARKGVKNSNYKNRRKLLFIFTVGKVGPLFTKGGRLFIVSRVVDLIKI